MLPRAGHGAATGTDTADAAVEARLYIQYGISLQGLELFIRESGLDRRADRLTTNQVCHTLVRPLTAPEGWADEPSLDTATHFYTHRYVSTAPNERTQVAAPPGTSSFAQLLATRPNGDRLVGPPTVFFSHPWGADFLSAVESIRDFDSTQPPPENSRHYFWFDCFVVDQHASQTFPLEWWGTTFKEAIRCIGHTLMFCSPWDRPATLRRSWCLWELFCTLDVGAIFTAGFSASDRWQFQVALTEDYHNVLEAFGRVDVEQAR